MQAIWTLLLDSKFMHAYEHGVVIECGDGIRRRVFPRFFTYSADTPEKFFLSLAMFHDITEELLFTGPFSLVSSFWDAAHAHVAMLPRTRSLQ